ncbi:putative methyltransferase [Abditibacteriota bacterium]|nr:putative methyltransferase [Abditibacteriota bacterium]
MLSSTQRFSDRVENYVKYRPSYPRQIIATLETECGLTSDSIIADVGSGTGILTALLLEHGNTVYAVEPNLEMRSAAENLLGSQSNFISVDGTAEATTLQANSVDFVMAGQAFHWFEPVGTRREFQRILRPDGWVALVWNRRPTASTSFQDSYENLLRLHATEYIKVSHERIDAKALAQFFSPNNYVARHFPNSQDFDLESLRGRLLSSSYAPLPGQSGHDALMTGLDDLFARYNENGSLRFEYETEIVIGHVDQNA